MAQQNLEVILNEVLTTAPLDFSRKKSRSFCRDKSKKVRFNPIQRENFSKIRIRSVESINADVNLSEKKSQSVCENDIVSNLSNIKLQITTTAPFDLWSSKSTKNLVQISKPTVPNDIATLLRYLGLHNETGVPLDLSLPKSQLDRGFRHRASFGKN